MAYVAICPDCLPEVVVVAFGTRPLSGMSHSNHVNPSEVISIEVDDDPFKDERRSADVVLHDAVKRGDAAEIEIEVQAHARVIEKQVEHFKAAVSKKGSELAELAVLAVSK